MEWIIIAILAVLVVGALLYAARERRTRRLREGFGPEYQRTVEARGDRRAAESDLLERERRREKLEIRELQPEVREHYAERWVAAQRRFVDEPESAVAEADALVSEVMRTRGYPVADEFERRAADVSVDHPDVVEHYRAAHDVSVRTRQGETSTEDLRQAMVHFRALFKELLGDDGREGHATRHDVKEVR
jgi:hypothetical protein